VFWSCLLRVDISEIKKIPNENLIEQAVVRVYDLELLYLYSKQIYDRQKLERRPNEITSYFCSIMNRLPEINRERDFEILNQETPDRYNVMRENKVSRPINSHFKAIIGMANVPSPHK
jgi:hypothetical protein